MKQLRNLNRILRALPINLALIIMCLLWVLPTFGLFVTSFRPKEDVRSTGWWEIFLPQQVEGAAEFSQYCASCHGSGGDSLPAADLTRPRGC